MPPRIIIQARTIIEFHRKCHPVLLFKPVLLLIFTENATPYYYSHPYYYSELKSMASPPVQQLLSSPQNIPVKSNWTENKDTCRSSCFFVNSCQQSDQEGMKLAVFCIREEALEVSNLAFFSDPYNSFAEYSCCTGILCVISNSEKCIFVAQYRNICSVPVVSNAALWKSRRWGLVSCVSVSVFCLLLTQLRHWFQIEKGS